MAPLFFAHGLGCDHFANTIFTADHRKEFAEAPTKTLSLHTRQDPISPLDIGHFMQKTMPQCEARLLDAVGHFPHMCAPKEVIKAIRSFL